ncbi:AAA family ATPase [Shewanella sp. HN-41]|uniref:AAA family ATPase n=1 Tax=Shewanella sp. HN-41 TaxID=327275 RepID=UPI00021264B2|nr:ATP-binding protein [Shewanella sp. HN-41]EGM71396.1 abortive infection protein [Shewanella sp. HN-41]
MIRCFGFSNFTSFKEGVEVSFEFDGKTPENIKNSEILSTVIGIKGANGSGKTNILRALSFLSYFCTAGARESSNKNKNERKSLKIAADSFFDNDNLIQFYIDFVKNEKNYTYEVDIKSGLIHRELISRKASRSQILIERKSNKIIQCLKSFEEFKNFELQRNTSILEMLNTYKFKNNVSELRLIHDFFNEMIINVNYNGYHDLSFDLSKESEDFFNEKERFEFVKEVIKISDQSVIDIDIVKAKNPEGEDIYFPVFLHKYEDKTKPLPFNQQSDGTKKLFSVLSAYFSILRTGGVLALDEFDIHLHAMILPVIIELFLNKDINLFGSQFIFTSHNTEIIDTLGKYRTFLVNKEDSESYGYRLDEIQGSMIRNDRPITPLYMEGKIGGIPVIKESKIPQLMSRLANGA